jgi:hypothetical protein
MRKPGSIEPIIYFRRADGYIILAPYTSAPCPEDCVREEADTLPAARKLQDILVSQERRQWESEHHYDLALVARQEAEMRDKFNERIASTGTSQYEKDFLRAWMQLRDERKREKYRKLYEQRQAYLYSLEYDSPGRSVSVESFNVERHDVKSDG